MISLIERGQSSATAVVLEKLASGLGVSLNALFTLPNSAAEPLTRHAQQVEWRDPQSGYVRRQLTPSAAAFPTQLVEIIFPPGARVAYESAAREPRIHQQVWLLDGGIILSVGDETYTLAKGDCLGFMLDRPTWFHNPYSEPARYLVALTTDRPFSQEII